MPVDDDKAMLFLVAEERLADPPKVELILVSEIDARPDPGMDEQIVAEAEGVGEAFEELDMRLRELGADLRDRQVRLHALQPGRVDAVAFQTFGPPELQPVAKDVCFAVKDSEHHLLVIAGDEDGGSEIGTIIAQPLDNAARSRPAVDQVAEEHHEGALGGARGGVLLDADEEIVQ
jgi:hypothetical protein